MIRGTSLGCGAGCGCKDDTLSGVLNDMWCGKDAPTTGFFCTTPVGIDTNFGKMLSPDNQRIANEQAQKNIDAAYGQSDAPFDPLNSLQAWLAPLTGAVNAAANPNTSLLIVVAAIVGGVILLRKI